MKNRTGLGWFAAAGILLLSLALNSIATRASIWQWSTTPSSNASSDSTINWREGQPPSSINDSARAMMAQIAYWRNSFNGSLADTGTSTAYAVTTNLSLASTPNAGQLVCFVPANTNGAAVTFSADGGTAFPIQTAPGVAVASAVMVAGTPYCVSYNATQVAWILVGYYASATNVPLGSIISFAGSSAPNSDFALMYGQAISRTTYAALFSLLSTTYGSGDGVTTFNVPDLRGRTIAGLDNMGGTAAGRISVAGGNFDGTGLGNSGGGQNQTIAQTNLPNVNFSVSDPGHTHTISNLGTTNSFGSGSSTAYFGSGTTTTNSSRTNITVSSGGSGTALPSLPPIMVMPYIMRIQ
jgi:microcystin-dependent protein